MVSTNLCMVLKKEPVTRKVSAGRKMKKTNLLKLFHLNNGKNLGLNFWPFFPYALCGVSEKIDIFSSFVSILKKDIRQTVFAFCEYKTLSLSYVLDGKRIQNIGYSEEELKEIRSTCFSSSGFSDQVDIFICFGTEELIENQIEKTQIEFEHTRDMLGYAKISGKNTKKIKSLTKRVDYLERYLKFVFSIGKHNGVYAIYEKVDNPKMDMTFCKKESLVIYSSEEIENPTLELLLEDLESLLFKYLVEDSFLNKKFSTIEFGNDYIDLALDCGKKIRFSLHGEYVNIEDLEKAESNFDIFSLHYQRKEIRHIKGCSKLKDVKSQKYCSLESVGGIKDLRIFNLLPEFPSIDEKKIKEMLFEKLKEVFRIKMIKDMEKKVYAKNWSSSLFSEEEIFSLQKEIEEKRKIIEYGDSVYSIICEAKNLGLAASISRKIIRKFNHGKFILSTMIKFMELGLRAQDVLVVVERFSEQKSKKAQTMVLENSSALTVLSGDYSNNIKKIFSEYLSPDNIKWLKKVLVTRI